MSQQAAHHHTTAMGTSAIKTVLVVDDSRLQRRILSAMLTRWGFEVFEAASAQDALALCEKILPDLVFSDWMMPGMTGLEFCQEFRTLFPDRYSYFILLTSKSQKDEIAHGLDSGADDFLTKPVNAHELRARISAGSRIVEMQRALVDRNKMIGDTLAELQELYTAIDNDLIEAKALQQSLVRDTYKSFGMYDVSLMLRSSGHVGGDLVGYFPAGSDHIGVFGIDVSGHGISSALMTARLAGYLTSASAEQNIALTHNKNGEIIPLPPEQVMAKLNAIILQDMETELYFTMLLAIIHVNSGRVLMSQAGHPHPVIIRNDGVCENLGTGGMPIGLIDGIEFSAFEAYLKSGDRLLICSDGITECPNLAGQMLEDAGLTNMVHHIRDEQGPEFLKALTKSLIQFAQTDRFPDDVSAVLIERCYT